MSESTKPKFIPKPNGADPLATRLVRELKHDRGILACRYDPTGRFIFAGARDYLVHRWDLSMQPEPEADEEYERPLLSVDCSGVLGSVEVKLP